MSIEGDSRRSRLLASSPTLLFRKLPRAPLISAAQRRELRNFASRLSENIASAASFTCLLTNDTELRRLNSDFLGHDYPTDVLSFPAGGSNGDLGEIAISVARADAQAADFGHSCLDEIRILMLHGFLHLTGLDHERDRGEMAVAERKWRDAFGLPSNLISRNQTARGARK